MKPRHVFLQALLGLQIAIYGLCIAFEIRSCKDMDAHFQTCAMDDVMAVITVGLLGFGLYSAINLFQRKPLALLTYSVFTASLLMVTGVLLAPGLIEAR